MTNEEILIEVFGTTDHRDIQLDQAMDAARKDEAVEFGKWIYDYDVEYVNAMNNIYKQFKHPEK